MPVRCFETWEALGGSVFILGHFKSSGFKGQRACTLPILQKFRKGIKLYTTPIFFLANKGISVVKDYNIPCRSGNTTWSSECLLSGACPRSLGGKLGWSQAGERFVLPCRHIRGLLPGIKEKQERNLIENEHCESVTFRKVIRQWH